MAADNVETYTLWIQRCLLCFDDSTAIVFIKRGKGRSGGWQHKGSLSLGRELSYWIFNIPQGTKQSYSSLVSGLFSSFFFFFLEGLGSRVSLSVSVNCCMLLSQLLA